MEGTVVPPLIPVIVAVGVQYGLVALGAGTLLAALGGAVAAGLAATLISGRPEQATGSYTVNTQRNITVRSPVAPWQIIYGQVRCGGVLTYVEESTDKQVLAIMVTLSGHVCDEITSVYFDDEDVTPDEAGAASGAFAGYATINLSTGDEGSPQQPFPDFESSGAFAGLWTSAHAQTGRTKLLARLTSNVDLYPTGVPNITAVIKGKMVRDPRESPDSDLAWSSNPALCLADYLCDANYGLGCDWDTEIDHAALAVAADVCDEQVERNVSPTEFEARYQMNGAFRSDETPQEIIERMLVSMAGWAVNVGGKWVIHAGAYVAPTVTLDEGDLAGPIQVQTMISRRSRANGVRGTFTDRDQLWVATDFPPIASDAYLAEDNDERVWKDIDLTGFVTSGSQAQRLAKIELLRLRQGLSVSATFKLTAFQVQAGQTVAITNEKFGWAAKTFMVEASRFVIGGEGELNVALDLRETGSAIFDWAADEEQAVDPIPNTNLPDPRSVSPPSGSPDLEFTQSGLTAGSVQVSWNPPNSSGVLHYQVEYKLVTESAYTVLPRVTDTMIMVTGLLPRRYDFRVKAVNQFGVSSAFAVGAFTVSGLLGKKLGSSSGIGALGHYATLQFAGTGANGVCWCPLDGMLYVADYLSNLIYVINPINDIQIDEIECSDQPASITYCPVDTLLYVLCLGTSGIKTLNPQTREVSSIISGTSGSGGTTSRGLFCPVDNTMYFANGNLIKFNPTNQQIELYNPGTIKGGLAYAPSTQQVYACLAATVGGLIVLEVDPLFNGSPNNDAITIHVLSVASKHVAYAMITDRLYVTGGSLHNKIVVVNPSNGAQEATIEYGSPNELAVLTDIVYVREAQMIYTVMAGASNNDPRILAIRPETNVVEQSLSVPQLPLSITWVPGVEKLYVGSLETGSPVISTLSIFSL